MTLTASRPTASQTRGLHACLMLLVAVPQATLAAFVPAVPRIASDLAVGTGVVDRSIVLYMAGYAVAMAGAGMAATRFGLRNVQLAALTLHVVASVAVALSADATTLTVARVVQALGGGAGTVLARVYVQEILDDEERLPALTRLSTAIALTPALTPLVVGPVVDHVSWRPVVLAMGALSAGTLLLAWRVLPDPPARGSDGGELRTALSTPAYWWFTAVISTAWCVYFTFTTFSSTTFQVGLGTSATQFGLLYACVVVGYVVGSRGARRLSSRWSVPQVLTLAGVLAFAACAGMAAAVLAAPDQPLALAAPMAVAMVGVGAAFPLCQAGMLRSAGPSARAASGLFFFLQMVSGAAYTAVLSLSDPTTPAALSVAVLVPAVVLALLVTAGRRLAVGRAPRQAGSAATASTSTS